MKKWKIYLVLHTHWDKEWYFTKEASDVFLIDNFKSIIKSINNNTFDKSYTYDAQYSVIDDYLNYHPEDYVVLKKIVSDQKVFIGPWYSQPDMFNGSGESLIRNLILGITNSSKLGHSMMIGYMPDSFGFNDNLPQILNSVDCNGAIKWRGTDEKRIKNSTFNWWSGADGSKILTHELYKFGYFAGMVGFFDQFLKEWDPISDPIKYATMFHTKTKPMIDELKTKTKFTGNRILIPVGGDQMPISTGWNDLLSALNEIDENSEWILSDFDQYFYDIKHDPKINLQMTPIVEGDFRYGQYTRAHKTINSTYYVIKKLNKEIESLIYTELEPLTVLMQINKNSWDQSIINQGLKSLVVSQAHDSLGACCAPDTNLAILARLKSLKQMITSYITLLKRRIADSINLKNFETLIFNLDPVKRNLEFTITIYTETLKFLLKNSNGKIIDYSLISQNIIDNKLYIVNKSTHLKNQNSDWLKNSYDTNGQNNPRYKYCSTIKFKIKDMKALSYQKLNIEQINYDQHQTNLVQTYDDIKQEVIIENKYYKVLYNAKDNKLDLEFKKTEIKTVKNFLQLICRPSCGDTYDDSPKLTSGNKLNNKSINQIVMSKVKSFKSGTVSQLVVDLIYQSNWKDHMSSKVEQPVRIYLSLDESDPKIDFKIVIKNKWEDVIWTAIVDSKIKSTESFAEQSMALTKHPVIDKYRLDATWQTEKWTDCPIERESVDSFVYLANENRYTALIVKGTNEYQILGNNGEKIALTLFRTAEYFGQRNLYYRPGRASGNDVYPEKTKYANMHNETLHFNFAVIYEPIKELPKLPHRAVKWRSQSSYYQKQNLNCFEVIGDTFVLSKNPIKSLRNDYGLDIELKNLVVSAFKPSIDKESVIIRLYNPSFETIIITPIRGAVEVNSLENNINQTSWEFTANKFRTYKLDIELFNK